MQKSRTSSTPSSNALPSFWNRWTRLSSSSSSTSPRTEVGSSNGEEGLFITPSRKPNHCDSQRPQDTEFSDEEDNSLLITPSDINRTSFPKPKKNTANTTPSQSSGLYSRLRPLRGGSLFASSDHPTPESLRSIRTRHEEEEEEGLRRYRGHGRESSILASFLKNNGGYMDDSESDDDDFPPPPVLQHLPLHRSRISVRNSTNTSTPSRSLNRNRSVHTPARSAGPSTPTSMRRSQMMTPVPVSKTRAEMIVAEERRAWRRRSEGQALFRSLVLGEDDILRVI
ncbi:hypothetical protein DFH28DRAFT_113499 [Melampsora americana]|nr:hypothetical protein DFH28DRAFT_113499 [Melampsora americana]